MSIFNKNTVNRNSNYSDRKLTVRKDLCPQNHLCPSLRVCPLGALSQKGFAAPVIDYDKCIKCGKCVKFCPMKALVFE